jgi:hypothetical protein
VKELFPTKEVTDSIKSPSRHKQIAEMKTNKNYECLHSNFLIPPKSHTDQQEEQVKASTVHAYSMTQAMKSQEQEEIWAKV